MTSLRHEIVHKGNTYGEVAMRFHLSGFHIKYQIAEVVRQKPTEEIRLSIMEMVNDNLQEGTKQ